MKRVLLVSYHFPPDAAVGALRPLKFAKYLPEFGWSPYLLTVKEKYYKRLDQSRMGDVTLPAQVFRTSVWPNPDVLYLKLKEWGYRLTGKRHILEEKVNTYYNSSWGETEGKIRRLRRTLLSLFVIAGGKLGWFFPATFKALLLVRRYKIESLYTSGPPHTAHLIGLAIKKLYNKMKWVADFRDPWTLNPGRPVHITSNLSEGIERWMEKQVMMHADRIISVNERMEQAFSTMYPEIAKTKVVTIPNGFDPDDFSDIQRSRCNDKFRVSYLGSFYMGRTPKYFLRAVRDLITEQKLQPESLEIRFIGACRYSDGESVEEMVRNENLSAVVKIIDPLPYKQALAEMVTAHVLLLFAPNQYYQIPAKAFEYLASGADIITFTSAEGATADLIRSTGQGVIVTPDSISQIKNAVEICYRKYMTETWKAGEQALSRQTLHLYHRKALTKKLVSVLE